MYRIISNISEQFVFYYLLNKEVIYMAQTQDKHCSGCGWTGRTSSDTCPVCGRELSDD